jgi:hypothetical protein
MIDKKPHAIKYKIVNLPKQIRILSWKNWINIKRNIVGLFFEFVCPFVFVSFLIIIRNFIEKIRLTSEFNEPNSVLNVRLGAFNQTRNLVLFHPNTDFVRNLVENAVELMMLSNPGFRPTGFFMNYLF